MYDFQTIAQYTCLSCAIASLCILCQVSYTVSEYSPYETYSSSDIRNLFSPQSGSEDVNIYDVNKDDEYLPIDKRYASLSYYYGGRPRNKGSPRYYHNRYYRSRYYQNYHKPWMNLDDRECFREQCQMDNDCCRRYSKCDRSAHVCYSCWYGHPCRKSRDCCERYPHCDKTLGSCTA
ncbi:uncharacterized protein LOC128224611 isoform X1 [Mya arenaria]|uniref:uncharacterized protein LOC128224611 isoform X1 n=1 Tax=Mya arenaria TaxID=6604 RepID=UPI0022DF1600|nr:uncharacterized protein LOC128224611 isoform X1 [Mya arenaria]